MKHLIVKVNGNILIETTGHTFHYDIACLGSDDIFSVNRTRHQGEFMDDMLVIDGDLVLDESTAVLPYASYVAMKGIACNEDCRPSINKNSWRERNNEIKDKLNANVPQDCESYFYNGLYLSLCSSVELALMDMLLLKVTACQKYYNQAVAYWIKKENVQNIKADFDDYFITIIKYYINSVVYHRFEEVRSMYKDILNVDLPSTSKLRLLFRKRDNFVHRFAISNLDRITITNASKTDVIALADEANAFLSQLEQRLVEVSEK